MKFPAWVQPLLNQIPHALAVAGTAFGAGVIASLQTADWKPALSDLLAGHPAAAVADVAPALATALTAGLMTLAALVKTSPMDAAKVKLVNDMLTSKTLSHDDLHAVTATSASTEKK